MDRSRKGRSKEATVLVQAGDWYVFEMTVWGHVSRQPPAPETAEDSNTPPPTQSTAQGTAQHPAGTKGKQPGEKATS